MNATLSWGFGSYTPIAISLAVTSNTPIGNVFAFVATLPKSQFEGLIDLDTVAKLVPERITFDGSSVTFSGPVAIVSSVSALFFGKIVISAATGILAATMYSKKSNDNNLIALFIAIVAGGMAYYAANKYMPSLPGIFFRDQQFLFQEKI